MTGRRIVSLGEGRGLPRSNRNNKSGMTISTAVFADRAVTPARWATATKE
jgi:hypothetical protein